MALFPQSNLAVLLACGEYRILTTPKTAVIGSTTVAGFPFGTDPVGVKKTAGVRQIALCHRLVWAGRMPFPGAESSSASAFLKQMSGYDLVVVGDNHKSFIVQSEGRTLLSPGSMMRTSADQIDHRPAYYYWYASTNRLEPVYWDIKKDAVSRKHIEAQNDNDARIEAFVRRITDDMEVGLCFEENLKTFLRKNKTTKTVEHLVWEAVEGGQGNG
jgi:hypothetical protein